MFHAIQRSHFQHLMYVVVMVVVGTNAPLIDDYKLYTSVNIHG